MDENNDLQQEEAVDTALPVNEQVVKPAKVKTKNKGNATIYRMMMFIIGVITLVVTLYIAKKVTSLDKQEAETIIDEVDSENLADDEDNVSGGVLDTGVINDGDLTLEQIQEMSYDDIIDTYLISKTNALKNNYSIENVNQDEDYWFYQENGKKNSKIGIDVSSYQGDINWKKVKNSGVEFAIIRVGIRGYGSGKLVEDENFETNIKEAIKAGLEVGVYFFSQSIDNAEAREEAEFVCNLIKKYDIKLPVVYDTEKIVQSSARTNKANLTANDRTEMAIEFCDYVEGKGYDSMIYSNKRWFLRNMNLEKLDDYNIWLAQYSSEFDYPFHFGIWQYTSKGKVPGIDGDVDMDIYMPD